MTRTVFSLIIINKAGGLIYQREYQAGLRSLSTNDYLVLAGTFHGYGTFFFLGFLPSIGDYRKTRGKEKIIHSSPYTVTHKLSR